MSHICERGPETANTNFSGRTTAVAPDVRVEAPPAEGYEVIFDIMRCAIDAALKNVRIRHQILKSFTEVPLNDFTGRVGVMVDAMIQEIRDFNENEDGNPRLHNSLDERTFLEDLREQISTIRGCLADTHLVNLIRVNTKVVGEIFYLPEHERRFIYYLALSHSCKIVNQLIDNIFQSKPIREFVFCELIESDIDAVSVIIMGNSSAEKHGLIHSQSDYTFFTNHFSLRDQIKTCLVHNNLTAETLRSSLLNRARPAKLVMEDFPHMADAADLCVRTLRGAAQAGMRNISILIFGPPGTGKTELSRIILEQAGLQAYAVGETEYGADIDRNERFEDLLLAHTLLANDPNSACIFDEMEDIMNCRAGDGTKIILNRLLDDGKAVTIFIANSPDMIPDYVLRRMTLAIEVPVPPRNIQRSLLADMARKAGIGISEQRINDLVEAACVVPAVARSAVNAARLAGGQEKDLVQSYISLNSLLSGRKLSVGEKGDEDFYSPEFSETSIPLSRFARKLHSRGPIRTSFLFFGVPGTGKSAGARYIAREMGLHVIEKRASDLLGAYVGDSEKSIRRAFEEAQDEKAALVFDEIDSLISDRKTHVRGWETSQVNEFLRCLEQQEAPVFGCTNLRDNIDKAAMRRFLFHVEFKALPQAKATSCFEHYMKQPAPSDLAKIDGLVPAHFELLKKRCDVLNISDPKDMIDMLREEIVGQPEFGPVGFVAIGA